MERKKIKQSPKGMDFYKLQEIIQELKEVKESQLFNFDSTRKNELTDFYLFSNEIEKIVCDKNFKKVELPFDKYKWLVSGIPVRYWNKRDNGNAEYVVGHYKDVFFEIGYDYEYVFLEKITEEINRKIEIFDYEAAEQLRFLEDLYPGLEIIKKAYKNYSNSCNYRANRDKYIKTEKVEIERPNSKYSVEYSMSKEEEEKMNAWRHEHTKKVHGGKYNYSGATPVDRYSVKYQATGLGMSCDCVCEECYKKYEEVSKDNKIPYETKRKLYQKAVYVVQEVG